MEPPHLSLLYLLILSNLINDLSSLGTSALVMYQYDYIVWFSFLPLTIPNPIFCPIPQEEKNTLKLILV